LKTFKEKLPVLAGGLLITMLLASFYLLQPKNFNKLEYSLYDTLLTWVKQSEPSGLVTIVDIDEKSLAEIGQWPWPRYKTAELLEKLRQMQVLSVGIDFLFAEPDGTSLKNISNIFQSTFNQPVPLDGIPPQLLDNDQKMSEILSSGPFVIGYSFLFDKNKNQEKNNRGAKTKKDSPAIHPLNVLFLYDEGSDKDDMLWYKPSHLVNSLNLFSKAVNISGFFNVSPDQDGIIRKVPLMMQYQEKLYPSLSLATLMSAIQAQQLVLKISDSGLNTLLLDEQQIPLDNQGNFWIHFRNTDQSAFQTVSAIDVLNNNVAKHHFENRIILLGTSAKGLHDLRTTPYNNIFPGVEIHATLIDNIIRGDFINHPSWSWLAQFLLLIAAGLLSLIIIAMSSAMVSFILNLLLISLLLFGSWWWLQSDRIYLSVFYPSLLVILNFSILSVLQYRLKEKKLIVETLEHNKIQSIALDNLEKAKSELEDLSSNLEQQVKERTQSLKTSEEKTRLLLTSVGEGIFGVGNDELVNFINPAALKMLQYDNDDIIGQKIHPLIHHTTSDEQSYAFKDTPLYHALAEGKITHTDDEILWRKDGSCFPVEYNARPVIKDNQISGAVITFTDISVKKAIEKEKYESNKKLSDSIRYASLIQHSLIPQQELFSQTFKESFVIWQPKDVVGGDIYLFQPLRHADECLLMIIDCTGHGVPGAFVTMLVKAVEQDILAQINAKNNLDEVSPADILSHFNQAIKKLLKQENSDSISDAGFDGGILYYNKKQKRIKFSGAETNLFVLEENELKIIKGNKHSIGYKKSKPDYEFKEHLIEINEGMQLYLTTDGYLDQKGGEKGFCFGKKRFQKLLSSFGNNPMQEQENILLNHLSDYQGNYERNDDVTVIGLKI